MIEFAVIIHDSIPEAPEGWVTVRVYEKEEDGKPDREILRVDIKSDETEFVFVAQAILRALQMKNPPPVEIGGAES